MGLQGASCAVKSNGSDISSCFMLKSKKLFLHNKDDGKSFDRLQPMVFHTETGNCLFSQHVILQASKWLQVLRAFFDVLCCDVGRSSKRSPNMKEAGCSRLNSLRLSLGLQFSTTS